jgi:OOP family OmpA-OmpF porin
LRTFIGIAVLLVGWVTLGLIGSGSIFKGFNFGKDAKEIESVIAQSAQATLGKTTYGVQTSVSGRDIRVSGTVANDIEKAAILANLDATHGRRVVVDELNLIDIATPYTFRGSKSAGELTLWGYAPTETALGIEGATLTVAGGMPDENWPAFVALGAKSIDQMKDASFQITDRSIQVSGVAASFEQRDAVRAMFDTLPEGYRAQVSLDIAPTIPYVFNGTRTQDGDTYSGYVPSPSAAVGLTGLIGDDAKALKPTAGMPDDNWLSVVGVGVKAMKSLNAGELSVVDRDVFLTGSVNTPDAVASIQDLFATMPDGYTASVNLKSLDDGTPAILNFDWVAGKGGAINGKGADGMTLDDLTGALNLPKLEGVFRQGRVRGRDTILAKFKGIAPALPLLESAKAQVSADKASFTGVLLPGGDLEIAEAALLDALGDDADISLTRSALEPKEGDKRRNADTGKDEVFQGGFWLVVPKPVVVIAEPVTPTPITPEPTVPEVIETPEPAPSSADVLQARCETTTKDILAEAKISFETGSATLTAQSRDLLTRLGAVMGACAGVNGLRVNVGGHTDSQGSDKFNLDLSQKRANSVRDALIQSGVSQDAITSTGFGETQPIATNDTEEGRAQNRRTTFDWVQK